MKKQDPIFGLPVPVIFAHRGGAGEAPESTVEGFLHGLQHGAQVLEFDVQLTHEGVPVVWHGPKLDNAFDEGGCYQKGKYISCWHLEDPSKQLWIRHPKPTNDEKEKSHSDGRRLLTLVQFLNFVSEVEKGEHGDEYLNRPIHLNIELKKN